MSFLTALSLSLNNLFTKKGRTILTSFAGSIGIIGISLILSLLGVPVYLQVIIFLAVSVVLVFATRPLYNKYVKPRMVKTNVDSLIGEQGVVKQDIVNDDARGLVKVNGQTWSARSSDGNIIKEGQKVEILSIEGVKLIVRSVG